MYLRGTVPFGMEDAPLQGTSVAPRKYGPSALFPKFLSIRHRLGSVRKAMRKDPYASAAPSALVAGQGWLVMPHDPARAVGVFPFAHRLAKALDGDVGVVCTAEVATWLSKDGFSQVLSLPSDADSWSDWFARTSIDRRAWAFSLDAVPDHRTLSALLWLGGERRLSLDLPSYDKVANILLPANPEGGFFRETVRQGIAQRLGLSLPDPDAVRRSPGKSIILELPCGLTARSGQAWISLASSLAEGHSLIVVHTEVLDPALLEALRALGNRLSLMRLSRPEDVSRIASEVRVWVGLLGPAVVIATQRECPVVVLGAADGGTLEFGTLGGRSFGPMVFLPSRKPSPGEVHQAVLDLTPHGM